MRAGRVTSSFMAEALALAEQALGWSSPNPAVGAVVVCDGVVIGRGRTQPPGGDHAEVGALREAGAGAAGATVYVTLEPCGHHGRTPPCTEALLGAGVARVVYAIGDPDAHVSGDGHRQLAAAGVAVEAGDGADEASELLEGYLWHRRTGLPFVIAKFAASLDGRIAAASGDSRWVSGPEARARAHEQRARIDALVVGSNTVLTDDPQLTARPEGARGAVHQPLRVVVDSTGRVPAGARVLQGDAPALVATTAAAPGAWRAALERAGAEVLELPAHQGRVDLEALLGILGGRGVLCALFEGGGTLLGSLFDRRLVQRVEAVIAPLIIGAAEAPAAVAGRGAYRMADAARLHEVRSRQLGEDVLVSGLVSWPET
jgi:diaminohydroxyphosphoribosylaminopyrimidine deaminase/5-amino-6-(5-phosphoribosylamino)uracil reductase